jgi:hypothetical protein
MSIFDIGKCEVNKEGKEETNEHFGRGDEKKTDNTSAWPIRH